VAQLASDWRRPRNAFVFGRRNAELDAAAKAIGGNVTAVQGDVTKLSDLDRLYSAVKAEKGKLDIVFAAAVAEIAGLEQVTEEHFDRHFDIKVDRRSSLYLAESSSTAGLGRLRHRDGIYLRHQGTGEARHLLCYEGSPAQRSMLHGISLPLRWE
jgi:NAD(P)-dependent dehydrogenase (short-subunit alcohol dehydrogenase family)